MPYSHKARDVTPSRRYRSALWRALRTLGACVLLTTCTHDDLLGPGVAVSSNLDLTGLLRAGGQIPIPVDTVFVELRHRSDSTVAFTHLYPAGDVGTNGDSLLVRLSVEVRRSPEQFYLYAEARGAGVLYYTVRDIVTITAGAETRTAPLVPLYVGPGAAADSVQLALSVGSVAPGDSVLAQGIVYQNDLPVAGAPVGILSADTVSLKVRPAAIGTAWLVSDAGASGTVGLTVVTPNGVTTTGSLDIVSVNLPGSITPTTPTTLSGVVNQLVGQPPSVQVYDLNDNPLPGATVTFAVTGGGGSVTGGTQTTDANGSATVGGWRLGQTVGANTLTATVSGLAPVTFTATAGPTAVASLARISGDAQTANSNSPLPNPLVVEVRDSFSNVVPGATVTWSVTDGTISPATSTADAQGRAQSSWTLGALQASPTATASVGSVQTSFSATTVFPNPAILLSFAGVPGVGVGLSATVNVALNQPAAALVPVALSSSNTGVFTVSLPDTVYIAVGQTSGTKVINGISIGTATLTGTAPGYTTGTLTVDVQNRQISVPTTLNVPYGQTASLPIQLPAPAPAGGVTFAVASSDPATVGVQTPTVTIPAGGQTANAVLSGVLPGPATITVSNPAYVTGTSAVTTTASLRFVQGSASLNASFGTAVTVNFESNGTAQAAPSPGIPVTLTASDPTCLAVTSPQTIATGLVSISPSLTYGGSASLPCTTQLKVSATNLQPDSINVTVQPVPKVTVQGNYPQVGSALEESGIVVLQATNHGGTTVTVTSSDPTVMLLSTSASAAGSGSISVPVLPGGGSFSIYFQALPGQTGTVIVTATASGFNPVPDTLTVVPPGVEIPSNIGTITTLSPDANFYAQVGVPNGNGTALARAQNLRGGGTPLVATFTSSDPTSGTIVDSTSGPAGNATGTAHVAPAVYYTSTSGPATGGVAFHPIATGTPSLTVAIPGFATMSTNGTKTVTVIQPVITATPNFQSVGGGLMETGSFFLGASQTGGADVTVASMDPAVLLVSPNATTAGTGSFITTVPNGQTSQGFTFQGVEGASGTVGIVVSEPRFVPDTIFVTVVQPGVEIQGLLTTTTTLSGDDNFYAQVGVPNATGTILQRAQNVRPGAPGPLNATFTSRVTSVGTIVDSTSGAAGNPAGTARIPSGRYYT
ncbi:MAG TPA: Ig-like domain-containing protein, partial [Gemmatimonadales bacterium]|nr:Ig-like domain-containing protein [Gemmatimonadales bacterium]